MMSGFQAVALAAMHMMSNLAWIFVMRKKGSETKKRMKEEEIEKGDCGPLTRKVFFWDFVGLEPSGTYNHLADESQTC